MEVHAELMQAQRAVAPECWLEVLLAMKLEQRAAKMMGKLAGMKSEH